MSGINKEDKNIGVCFLKKDLASVCVWSPEATTVSLVLEKENKTIPVTKRGEGYWQLITTEIKEGDLYQFSIDGKKALPDPASRAQPQGVHGPSQAIDVTSFIWNDEDWKNPKLEEYILYELHTGTFSAEGTFAAIEEKLDHLLALGITAIELMPVAQFPGSRNWGYDGVYPFAVQDSYGGAEGLQRLVNACHKKGLAVVLDVVYNHLGPEGNYLSAYGPYFTEKYKTPWGGALNFDDAWCDGVRDFFIQNALMWFRDFHIDALRLDAVHAIKDFSPVHFLKELKQQVNALIKETGRPFYLIVESDLNDTRYINEQDDGGYGMDAQWIDEFHHALRVTAGEPQTGYYKDFSGIEHLAKAYTDAYVYDGQYSPHRKKKFGIKADKATGKQFVVFSQNHDQIGNRMLGERTTLLVSFEMQKLLAGAVFISPYLPMLFMGEEWGEPNPFLYFISHTDKDLVEAVRTGRSEEFAAFHAQGEAPDPAAVATFERSKLQWNLLEKEPHNILFQFYKSLISLRKKQPALQNLNRKNITAIANSDNQTLLVNRWCKDQEVLCLLNFSKQPQPLYPLQTNASFHKIFDSADPVWKGPLSAPQKIENGFSITLQPESFIIYSNTHV